MIRDTLLGSPAIKGWGTEYLKPRKGQDKEDYSLFLDSAVFYNAVDKTKNGLLAVMFSEVPKWKNYPEKFKGLFNEERRSVTKDGNTVNGFLKNLATEVLTTGRAGVLVDRSAYTVEGEVPPDPYLVTYAAEDIINWVSEIDPRTGLIRITQVALLETVTEPNETGIGMREQLRMRVLCLDSEVENGVLTGNRYYSQRVFYEKNLGTASLNNPDEYIVPTLKGAKLDYIPFFFTGSVDNTENISKPPLLDIADLNVSHYQSYALLEMARRFTATPIYYISGEGMHEEENIFVGANCLWKLGKDDKAGVIEFNGQGLKFLENALDKKEEQIQTLGGKLVGSIRKGPGTSSSMISAQGQSENSILKMLVTNLEESVGLIFAEYFKWSFALPGTYERVTVNLVSEAKSTEIGAREIRALQGLYDSGLMPKDKLFEILRDADFFPDDMTLEEFIKMLKDPEQLPTIVQPSDNAELMPGGTKPKETVDPRIDAGSKLKPQSYGDAANKGLN